MRMRWLNDITDSMDEFEEAPEVGDGQEQVPGMLQSMGLQSIGGD